ncbi:hypothetical protein V498_06424 [Pseudogymnoascus sp. VKM F-4517 (FW-2822)]|nr:hypothetical protein V498_06424 [Pseudogymnoascus sp. VKM F-4517 (FW-2822)]
MDEEGSVSTPSTPSTTSVSTPPSPPMRGTKVRPLNDNAHSNRRERSRPSVFQGDGLEAFVEMYGGGDRARSPDTPDPQSPQSPMKRYQQSKGDDPWQPETMGGQVVCEYSGEVKGERVRQVSYAVEDSHKVFGGTEEAQNQTSNKISPATIETGINDAKETIPIDRTQKSHLRDLMAQNQAERQKKISKRGVYAPARQRKNTKKDHGASVVIETGEVAGVERDEKDEKDVKRIADGISVRRLL